MRRLPSILLQKLRGKKSLYLVMTSDRGFSGAYNHNITQKVLEHIEAGGKNAEIIAIGQKGYEFLVAGTLI